MKYLVETFRLGAAALALFLFASAPARAQQPGQTLTLKQVVFEGLARVKPEEALARSGLQEGQTATLEQIEAAADRLSQSGLFSKLGYSIKGRTDAAVLTFQVVEMKWGVPVVFDNFIWFTDEELNEAVRRQVPSYDGTAPEGGAVTDQIKQALQDLLRARKIEGTVEYLPSADASGREAQHVFSVKGAGLRVCSLKFAGATAVSQDELVRKSTPVFDNDYSRLFVNGFLASTLLPVYQERGMLRASLAILKVEKATPADDCAQGLAVTVAVDEGSIYVWDKAAWEGNQALTEPELNFALNMRARDVAGAAKLEKGLNGVRKAYGRKGYLLARVAGTPEFDDENRRVSYHFKIAEGPQYRMGTLTLNGLDERDTNNLRGRWRLLPGDPYDDGYLDEFLKKGLNAFAADLLREGRRPDFKEVKRDVQVDNDKLTVNVTLDFKK